MNMDGPSGSNKRPTSEGVIIRIRTSRITCALPGCWTKMGRLRRCRTLLLTRKQNGSGPARTGFAPLAAIKSGLATLSGHRTGAIFRNRLSASISAGAVFGDCEEGWRNVIGQPDAIVGNMEGEARRLHRSRIDTQDDRFAMALSDRMRGRAVT